MDTDDYFQTVAESNVKLGGNPGTLPLRDGKVYQFGGGGIPSVHKREAVHTHPSTKQTRDEGRAATSEQGVEVRVSD